MFFVGSRNRYFLGIVRSSTPSISLCVREAVLKKAMRQQHIAAKRPIPTARLMPRGLPTVRFQTMIRLGKHTKSDTCRQFHRRSIPQK